MSINYAVNLAKVLEDEDKEVAELSGSRGAIPDLQVSAPSGSQPWPMPARLGVAFSGGGIRSASVNLGLIQALARSRLLPNSNDPDSKDLERKDDLLRHVHYISGISGGGYILGWLTAWISRIGFNKVQEQLASNLAFPDANVQPGAYHRFLEPQPLRNLRQYASFLTPRVGLFSGDTLAMIALYTRNLLLNQVLMAAAVACVVALAQMLGPSILWASPWSHCGFYFLLLIAVIGAITGGVFIGRSLGCLAKNQHPEEWKGNSYIARGAALVTAVCIWLLAPSALVRCGTVAFLLGSAALVALASICASVTSYDVEGADPPLEPVDKRGAGWFGLLSAIAAGGLFLLLMYGLERWLKGPQTVYVGSGYVTFGLPFILLALALSSYIHIGVYGNAFPDAKREWLARLAGYFLYFGALTAVVISIVLWGPLLMHLTFGGIGVSVSGTSWLKWIVPGGWVFTVISGLLAAKSPNTGTPGSRSYLDILAKIAPPAFLVGVLMLVSWGLHGIVRWEKPVVHQEAKTLEQRQAPQYLDWVDWRPASSAPAAKESTCCAKPPAPTPTLGPILRCYSQYWKSEQMGTPAYLSRVTCGSPSEYSLLLPGGGNTEAAKTLFQIIGACALICGLLAWRLNINEFSLHLFYRNRLIRAFLGASNRTRKASPFSGFGLDDDVPLQDLCRNSSKVASNRDTDEPYNGPYPIWGTTLNLTSGEVQLAWQKRRGASFIYSPLYCGWDYVPPDLPGPTEDPQPDTNPQEKLSSSAYRGTGPQDQAGEYRKPAYTGRIGPSMGTALAASGAAISPNWGYHTTPSIAALLAIFDVRIGWWSGNPRHDVGWKKYAPHPQYLIHEVAGSIGDDDQFVYLSDGGHFENLGIYELVRRRMRYIIACDADADPGYDFEDLGNAIEKCRRDFGVEIEMRDVHGIRPSATYSVASGKPAGGGKSTGERMEGKAAVELRAGFSRRHYAVGKIKYPANAGNAAMVGTLLYIKSSLTDDEPGDVLSQHQSDPAFPHDTTINQFFDETKFEAYRALGEHMFEMVWKEFEPKTAPEDPELRSLDPTQMREEQIRRAIHGFFKNLEDAHAPSGEAAESRAQGHKS